MNNSTSTEVLTDSDYENKFKGKEKNALAQALDIRKFEIELYWKRATYFWTFIAATLAGFLAVQASSATNKTDLSVILSCLGIVFSFAWHCVNRGSKFWQENWEKHVDMLEDEENGPLYKVVLQRNRSDEDRNDKLRHLLTGPSQFSVSKINQLISLYVSVLWCILLLYSLPAFQLSKHPNWFYVLMIALSIAACVLFFTVGRSYSGGYYHIATLRKSRVKPTAGEATVTDLEMRPSSGQGDVNA